MVHFVHPTQNKKVGNTHTALMDFLNKTHGFVKGKDHMQKNTIKILLNFGQNNKQVNTLPPC